MTADGPDSDPSTRGRFGVPIEEDLYRADAAVLAQYQAYSAELLRLTLLGIAAIGYLFKDVALEAKAGQPDFLGAMRAHRCYLYLAVGFLLVAAATALAHRIFSADAFTCQLLYLRCTDPKYPDALDPGRAAKERKAARFNRRWSSNLLIASAIALGLGVTFLSIAFLAVLS